MNQPTKKVPFDIYLPATAATPAKLVETIEVEVYENFGEEFLTTESSELIERTRARHMGFLHGKDIRDLRKRLNLTQDQLSDLLDCGKKSLSRWESGRGLPSGIVNKFLRLLHDQIITPLPQHRRCACRVPSHLQGHVPKKPAASTSAYTESSRTGLQSP